MNSLILNPVTLTHRLSTSKNLVHCCVAFKQNEHRTNIYILETSRVRKNAALVRKYSTVVSYNE